MPSLQITVVVLTNKVVLVTFDTIIYVKTN